jgi:hypothetical protein
METPKEISAWLSPVMFRTAGGLSLPNWGGEFREGLNGLPGVSGHVLELQARFTI